jgi:hypothetical protein
LLRHNLCFFYILSIAKPTVYNYVSANQDSFNGQLYIAGLVDKFEIEIYNRWGKLIWKGNQNED